MITCRMITEATSAYFELPVREMHSRRKTAHLVHARHMGWYLAKQMTDQSFPQIGRHMGGVDHTTVLHGVGKMSAAVAATPTIAHQAEVLSESIAQIANAAKLAILNQLFPDRDALQIAEAWLDQPFRDMMPPIEDVRELASAVCHFAGELEIAQGDLASTRETLAEVQAALTALRNTPPPPPDHLLRTLALDVVRAVKEHETNFTSPGERAARARLDRCLIALRNHFSQQEKSHA